MYNFTKLTIFFWQFSYLCLAQTVLIPNVPDHSQPPDSSIASSIDGTNYCAPFAFLNIVDYWDNVQGLANASGMMGGLSPRRTAEYIGWFMDTNDQGNPNRSNGLNPPPSAPGTYNIDQVAGILDYIHFDSLNTFGFPYSVPASKKAQDWEILPHFIDDFVMYHEQINDGHPVKLDFLYWHISPTGNYVFAPEAPQDTIFIYQWAPPILPNTEFDPEAPWEVWNLVEAPGEDNIGHSVTGVGYIMDTLEFAIVHDNWANTPKNIAVPWRDPMIAPQLVMAMIFVHVPAVQSIGGDQNRFLKTFQLAQNFPNPFNSSTTITFRLPFTVKMSLQIFTTTGQKIVTLVEGYQSAGKKSIFWKGRDSNGKPVASGIYIYQLKITGININHKYSRKMLLLK